MIAACRWTALPRFNGAPAQCVGIEHPQIAKAGLLLVHSGAAAKDVEAIADGGCRVAHPGGGGRGGGGGRAPLARGELEQMHRVVDGLAWSALASKHRHAASA